MSNKDIIKTHLDQAKEDFKDFSTMDIGVHSISFGLMKGTFEIAIVKCKYNGDILRTVTVANDSRINDFTFMQFMKRDYNLALV